MTTTTQTTLLQIEQVSKTYHTRKGADVVALDNVSLQLEPGRFVGVCGPSGCGKSTLLLTAGGLLRPDSGAVRLGDQSLYELNSDRRAMLRNREIGFVFQQFHLVPYLNVRQNICAPALGENENNNKGRAVQLMEKFGLESRRNHRPHQLSAGERQRVALARAMFNEPALILADEPTGNLDDANSEVVLNELRQFVTAGGAVLLVTHDAQAMSAVDKLVKLNAGVVVD